MSKPRILIAGAGIGGIVAALALLQRGFEVALYEQAADLREIGAGVQISPNGSRVLCHLGLQAAMEAIASVPTAKDMRLFNTGQAWRVQDLGATAVTRFGSPYWLVHRGDFHAVLVQALAERAPGAVRVGARCIGFEQDADGVTLLLENGERVRGDALIGADGVHSRIRGQLFGGGARHIHRLHGLARRRADGAAAAAPAPAAWQHLDRPARPCRHLPAAARRVAELRHRDRARRLAGGKLVGGRHGRRMPPRFRGLASGHPGDRRCDRHAVQMGDARARAAASTGRSGRVEPAGRRLPSDAAVPGAGRQHGDRGRHGAGALSGTFSDVPEALRHYEVARLERTSRIVLGSLENVSRYHNPQLADPDQAQAFMDREFAPRAMGARYDWLYEYDALTVAV